jgi:small redox-active disulfide protein 2
MTNNIKTIQILGTNCAVCNSLFEITKEAVHQLGILIEVEYVTDIQKIIALGMKSAPVLVINGRVASSGVFLNVNDVKEILKNI